GQLQPLHAEVRRGRVSVYRVPRRPGHHQRHQRRRQSAHTICEVHRALRQVFACGMLTRKEPAMSHIILTEEQMRVIETATENVEVRDAKGNVLGTVLPKSNGTTYQRDSWETPEFFAEMKRRAQASTKKYSGTHVHAMLLALEAEWERTGGFDRAYMDKFLQDFHAKEKT